MSSATPVKHYKGADSFDAIVIGSGIGGLTTAVLLAKHGNKRVAILERHYTAGGFTHVFRRPGFDWDVGVHYIGDVNRHDSLLRRLFDHLTDGRLAWAPMGDVYDRVLIEGRRYDLVQGRNGFRTTLASAFPGDAPAIDTYLRLLDTCAAASQMFFMEKAVPSPLARFGGAVMRRRFLQYAGRTTREVLAKLTRNEELVGVLTAQYGDYGLPPAKSSFGMHAMVARHYLGGAAYPVGGAAAIAGTMLPIVAKAGGVTLVDAEVTSIDLDGNAAAGVRLRDGRRLHAPIVISDAGLATTARQLLPTSAPGWSELDAIAARVGPSLAHACLYVGLDRSAADMGLPTSNLWVFPGPDHDANVEAFLADPDAPLPLTYISFPSAKDPDFERRHPGHATIEALTLAPFEWFSPWSDTRWHRRGEEYEGLKARLRARLLDQVYAQVPTARGHVVHAELSTPLSTKHFANFAHGEIYGLAHTPIRFRERGLRPRTAVRGLYLTGCDVCTAGVAGALFGGVLTASAILGRNLMSVAVRPNS